MRPGFAFRIAAATVAAIGAAVACVGSDPQPGTPTPTDGGSTGTDGSPSDPDAPPTALAPCDVGAPFIDIAPVAGLNTAEDETAASFSADERIAYVVRTPELGAAGEPATDMYLARRDRVTDPFGAAIKLDGVNSPAEDDNITTIASGLTIYFHSRRADGGMRALYTATRSSLTSGLGAATPLLDVNKSSADDFDPFVMPDDQTLFFVSSRSGAFHLYRASRTSGAFGSVVEEAAVNTAVDDAGLGLLIQPVVSADGLELFFASGGSTSTTRDTYLATRSDPLVPFGPPRKLELNTEKDEAPTWISPDRCRLYIRSDRPGTLGLRDIWVASRRR